MARLIIVSGYNSVGKTTVGKALAKELGAVFIDSPKTTDILMEEIINAHEVSGTDFATVMKVRQMTELQVQVLRRLIQDQLELGLDVVLEVSTYYSDAHVLDFLQKSCSKRAKLPQTQKIPRSEAKTMPSKGLAGWHNERPQIWAHSSGG